MANRPFVHLHVHTENSLLDGAARVVNGKKSPLMEACIKKNMPAIAITDHGTMYGVFTFQKKAIEAGIKPIIGCELYICEDMYDKTNKYMDHILLIAKNNDGYRNLVKLDSMAFIDGFYYKPRIDFDFLAKHAKGLICTSACIGGTIPQYLIRGEYQKAKEYAIKLRDMFDEGDFYIELQNHGIREEEMCIPLLIKLAKEIGVKVVATNDVHYIEREDAEAHDVLLCIQTGRTIEDKNRMKFDNDSFYLKTYEEMEELFGFIPEALETPFEIMDKCNVKIEKYDLIPSFAPADGSTPAEFLRKLSYEGLVKRYGVITDEIRERAEYELSVVIDLGYAEYYLIVWDFIFYAKSNDIPVGAGRGSGVGSIIAYAIEITNVDPLKYNLLFERFLNRERVSMPDFDIDFCVEGRGKVIEYVIEKYGSERVCQILAMGTMATKNAIRDVARVYAVPLAEVIALTKVIPNGRAHLDDILGLTDRHEFIIPEVVEAYRDDGIMHKVIDLALKLEGMPRNCSKHAAGVVICKEVISDFVPLSRTGEDITTQFQKDEVEEVGMLKMDFLGLRTLTDIDKAKKYVFETTGNVIDFSKLGYEDPKVYALISSGESDAIFQLESPGMKKFMKNLQPNCLEEIIAGISLYRPGPMSSIPQFVESKKNPLNITYDDPQLESILNMTYGCIVYQEQVMQIVQKLSGYTLGRADILRRAMGKKKADVMDKERHIFINGSKSKSATYHRDGSIKEEAQAAVEGALARGVSAEAAGVIFDKMARFAEYAFNKSHAAAYAVVAYETAYIKTYYPVQFIAAVINNRITISDEIAKYAEYLRTTGVELYPPDINKSGVYFRCEGKGLRFGLMGIKNVGEVAITAIVKERVENGEYKNLTDLVRRADNTGANKRLFESLIKGGALDCFQQNRATLLANYERIMLLNNHEKKFKSSGQLSMFGIIEEETGEDLVFAKEKPRNELLIEEKEALSIYMSGHPLDEYRQLYQDMPFNLSMIKTILDDEKGANDGSEGEDEVTDESFLLIQQYDKTTVELCGMISDIRLRVTKTSKTMAMARLEDLYSSIDIVIFPKTYDKFKPMLVKDNIVKVFGELQVAGGRSQIVVNDIKPWQLSGNNAEPKTESDTETGKTMPAQESNIQQLFVNVIDDDEQLVERVMTVLARHEGDVPCLIRFRGKWLSSPNKVNGKKPLMWELSHIVGAENVKTK